MTGWGLMTDMGADLNGGCWPYGDDPLWAISLSELTLAASVAKAAAARMPAASIGGRAQRLFPSWAIIAVASITLRASSGALYADLEGDQPVADREGAA